MSLSGEVNGEVILNEVKEEFDLGKSRTVYPGVTVVHPYASKVTMESLISEIAVGKPAAGIQRRECLARWMWCLCGLIHIKATIIVA